MALVTNNKNKRLIFNSSKIEKPVDIEKIKSECPYFESANRVHKLGN